MFIKCKKPRLKPVVGFSLSKGFNEAVSVDLKQVNGAKFLHIIGNAASVSVAAVVKSKCKEEVVEIFIKVLDCHIWGTRKNHTG